MELSNLSVVHVFIWGIWVLVLLLFGRVVFRWWVLPFLSQMNLKRNGFHGPPPFFPLGNIKEMKKNKITSANSITSYVSSSSSSYGHGEVHHHISHDIHSIVSPYFAKWQNSYGKKFVYWLGTEAFVYLAEPELVKKVSEMGKSFGKPIVFKNDRKPMFGDGLVMADGDRWTLHRHILSPAFNPTNLKGMTKFMVESITEMLDNWAKLTNSGHSEIDVEREITAAAGEIIAKASFGIFDGTGKEAFDKLRALHMALFKNSGYVGVPFSGILYPSRTLEAKRIGKEVDKLFYSIISERRRSSSSSSSERSGGSDLLSLLIDEKRLTARELVDECKTLFFGGHETTALAIGWSLMLLSIHPEWQTILREEIREVVGDKPIDFALLSGLKKMGWVFNEVLRLYPPAPNLQRQAKTDIPIDSKTTIPKGTNLWIDVISMHHDPSLWGEDVNIFKPERFEVDNSHGGCSHKMGYLPFGLGGRVCIGRNLSFMEFKVFLTLILSRFSFSLSPSYSHSPAILLSLRPLHGLHLILHPLL